MPAASSGSPNRRTMYRLTAGSSAGRPAVAGVVIDPSATLFTVIWYRPTSRATPRANPAAPAFAAQYAAIPGSPIRPASDTIVMTRPQRLSIMYGSAARVTCIGPYKLTLMNRSHSAGSESATAAGRTQPPAPALPALLTMMSMPGVRATASVTAAKSVTSNGSALAAPSRARICPAAASARSPTTSLTSTCAPATARYLATASPTPWPAPVTSARSPSSSISNPTGSGYGPGDLQRDQLVVGLAELPQDPVGVLGKLGRAPADDGRLVELDRVRDQLAFLAVVVDDPGDQPVLPQRGIHADLVGVLDQGPLALGAIHHLAPLLQRELADDIRDDLAAFEAAAQDRLSGKPRIGDQVGASHSLAELRPVPRRLEHAEIDPPAVRGHEVPHQRVAGRPVPCAARGLGQRAAGQQREVYRELRGPRADAQQRDVDHRRLAGRCSRVQSRRDAAGDRHSADVVSVRSGRLAHHMVGVVGGGAVRAAAPGPERRAVVAARVRVRPPGPEPGPADVDDVRVHRADVGDVESQPRPRARHEVRDEDVGGPDQVVENGAALRHLERDANAALAAVRPLHDREERRRVAHEVQRE